MFIQKTWRQLETNALWKLTKLPDNHPIIPKMAKKVEKNWEQCLMLHPFICEMQFPSYSLTTVFKIHSQSLILTTLRASYVYIFSNLNLNFHVKYLHSNPFTESRFRREISKVFSTCKSQDIFADLLKDSTHC